MANVQFEETSQFNLQNSGPHDPKIITFLIEKHIARNRSQASAILITVCIVILALSIFVIYRSIGNATKPVIRDNLTPSIQKLLTPKNSAK